jgi:hypothetical protein
LEAKVALCTDRDTKQACIALEARCAGAADRAGGTRR